MKCPLTFNNPDHDMFLDCQEDCAWLVTGRFGKFGSCAIATIASSATDNLGTHPVNSIQIESDEHERS